MKLKKTINLKNLNIPVTDAIHRRTQIVINEGKASMRFNSFQNEEDESRFDHDMIERKNDQMLPATIAAIENVEKQMFKELQREEKFQDAEEIEEIEEIEVE
jgi:hypothetical protein